MRFCSCFAHQCLPRWLLQCWKVARSKRLFARQTHLRSQESSPQGEIWKENRAEVWFWFILMRHQCIVGWNMIYYNISYFIGWAVSVERVSVDHHHHHQGAVPELRAWATLWTNLWYADLFCAFRTRSGIELFDHSVTSSIHCLLIMLTPQWSVTDRCNKSRIVRASTRFGRDRILLHQKSCLIWKAVLWSYVSVEIGNSFSLS